MKTPNNFEEDLREVLIGMAEKYQSFDDKYKKQAIVLSHLAIISTLCEEEVKRALSFDNLNYKIPRTFVLYDVKTGNLYQFEPVEKVIDSIGINMSKSYEGKLWLLNPAELERDK